MKEIEYSHQRLIELVKEYSSYQDFDSKSQAEGFAKMKENNGQKTAMMKVGNIGDGGKWTVFFK